MHQKCTFLNDAVLVQTIARIQKHKSSIISYWLLSWVTFARVCRFGPWMWNRRNTKEWLCVFTVVGFFALVYNCNCSQIWYNMYMHIKIIIIRFPSSNNSLQMFHWLPKSEVFVKADYSLSLFWSIEYENYYGLFLCRLQFTFS